MAVDFADVTDVAIPEGDVERITETVTGNVLWEKKKYWIKINATSGARIFDRGNDIFVMDIYGKYSRYNPATWEPIGDKLVSLAGSIECIDMDTSSKKFCLFHSGGATANSKAMIATVPGSVITTEVGGNFMLRDSDCCWASGLNAFCVIIQKREVGGGIFSFLINKTGNIINKNTTKDIDIRQQRFLDHNSLAYSPKANMFVMIPDQRYHSGQLITSSNGVSWTKRQIFKTTQYIMGVYSINELNIFLAPVLEADYSKIYIYQSNDGITWTKKGDCPKTIPSSVDPANIFQDLNIAYSPTKQIFLITIPTGDTKKCLLTKNFSNWEIIDLKTSLTPGDIIWSPSIRAFLCCSSGAIYKMYL